MADVPAPGASADWTASVEGAERSEYVRRRRWLRAYLGLLMLLMVATLALLALGVLDVSELRRSVAPAQATAQRLEASNATLARTQADIDARLRRAESELAALTQAMQSRPQASAPAPAEPRQRRRSGPSPLALAVAGIDQRLQRVEAAASAAEADRARIDGRLQRLDEAVGRLGAAIGPQSAP